MTDETIKGKRAHLAAQECKTEAESEEMSTLKAKNEDLEKSLEDLDEVKEDYNKLKDDHGQLKGNCACEVISLNDRIEKLDSGLPSPSPSPFPPQPPPTLTNVSNPVPPSTPTLFYPSTSHLFTPNFPRLPLEMRILTFGESCPNILHQLYNQGRQIPRSDRRSSFYNLLGAP